MPSQLLDIFRRCADEQIKIFGRSYEAVKSHSRGADEHIFESTDSNSQSTRMTSSRSMQVG